MNTLEFKSIKRARKVGRYLYCEGYQVKLHARTWPNKYGGTRWRFYVVYGKDLS